MILGLSVANFTLFHVILSLIGIASGIVVAIGLVAGRPARGWTAVFLLTTLLTTVTGFLFPISSLTPALVVGVISLALLAAALLALYAFHLRGVWRPIYIVGAVAALYLNVFVAVVQAFQKISVLQPFAPTQSEPPFVITQILVLAAFAVVGVMALIRYRPGAAVVA